MNRTPSAAPTSLADASRQLHTGELTATELLAGVEARIRETEPHARAYATLDLDRAAAVAAAADRTPSRGPLHGIPFGLKDVFAVRGLRTGCGLPEPFGTVGRTDAQVLADLHQAGAVLLGLQVTHQLTCGLDDPVTRNPAHSGHYAGGSSVGSAVSVATGTSFFALGTDAAGSVRIPASANGIVGLKPTRGLLSARGVLRSATAPAIDQVGILARTVEDVRLVLEALAPGSVAPGRADADVQGARIGILQNQEAHADDEVNSACDAAVRRLVDLGAVPVPVELTGLAAAPAVTGTVFMAELAAGNRALFAREPSLLHPGVAELIRSGLTVHREALGAAHQARRRLASAVETLLTTQRLDALALPTMPVPPPPLADLDPSADLPRLTVLTCPFNLSGHPAVSLPAGTTRDGLPIGVQLVGRRFDEATLLRLAAQLGLRSPYHQQER